MALCPKCRHDNPHNSILCVKCREMLPEPEPADSGSGYSVPGDGALDALNAAAIDPELFPADVRDLRAAGKGIAARKRLAAINRRETNLPRKSARVKHLANLRLWLEPSSGPPGLHTINGIGTSLYGRHQTEGGTWIATQWFTLVFIPIFPIRSFLVASAGANSWYFLLRAPHPPVAAGWGKFVAAAAAGAALIAAGTSMWSGGHGDLFAYNGFDVPLEVTVGGETQAVAPLSRGWFRGLGAGDTVHLTARAGDVLVQERDAVIDGEIDTVWNIAGRGVLAKLDVTYGSATSGEPIFYTDDLVAVRADHILTAPPGQVDVGSSGGAHRSVLADILNYEGRSSIIDVAPQLVDDDHAAIALQALTAELIVHPGSVAAAEQVAPQLDAPARLALWTRVRDAAPDSVEAHRAYQEAVGHTPELRAEYAARAAAAPTAANLYLHGRTLDDDAPAVALYRAAIAADASFPWAHYALGGVSLESGDWATAGSEWAEYARLLPEKAEDVFRDRLRVARILKRPFAGPEVQAVVADQDRFGIHSAFWQVADDPGTVAEARSALAARFAAVPELAEAEWVQILDVELTLTAGDLASARDALEAFRTRHPDADAIHSALLIELSDGGDRAGLARLLGDPKSVVGGAAEVMFAAAARALGVEGADARVATYKELIAKEDTRLDDVLDLAPADDAGLDAIVATLHPGAAVYGLHAAAWMADGAGDPKRARARRLRARALALPGEGPYVAP